MRSSVATLQIGAGKFAGNFVNRSTKVASLMNEENDIIV